MKFSKYLFVLLFFISKQLNAAHTKGGWMYYEYLGAGAGNNTASYRIVLKLYTECVLNTGQIDVTAPITIFNNVAPYTIFSNTSISYSNDETVKNCVAQSGVSCYPCISSAPAICYRIFTYTQVVDLPINANGYVVAYQRCCRVAGINNILTPSNSFGGTWSVVIPGTNPTATSYQNSSAKFSNNDTAIVCKGAPFTFDFSATDIDGDQLSYAFSPALAGGSQSSPIPNPSGSPSTFAPVDYATGYSGQQPLGPGVTINPVTGIVSGIAPIQTGIYVISVTVNEIRNGQIIASVRKELHINIADCSTIKPELEPDAITCDGYSFQFVNYNNSPLINSYHWDFGVPNVTNDTSNLPNPTFTYPDTGVYIVKVYINRGEQCSDSATVIRRVFPGFSPNFNTTGVCFTSPIQFNDASTTAYGVVNSWKWDFGVPTLLDDTSRLQNPTYQYTSPGVKSVQLIVTNSKGCVDTIVKNITLIDKPIITLPFKDTLICSIDTLQLISSLSSGNATWLPNYRIINPNSNNPFVYPTIRVVCSVIV
jgi:PKD repeat protein